MVSKPSLSYSPSLTLPLPRPSPMQKQNKTPLIFHKVVSVTVCVAVFVPNSRVYTVYVCMLKL